MMHRELARRSFLKTAGCGLLAAPLVNPGAAQPPQPATPGASKLTLNVREFGSTGDGVTKDTAAIQQAIDRCWVLGGGEVLVPAGNYLTGACKASHRAAIVRERSAPASIAVLALPGRSLSPSAQPQIPAGS